MIEKLFEELSALSKAVKRKYYGEKHETFIGCDASI